MSARQPRHKAISACYRPVDALPDGLFFLTLAIGRRHLAPGSFLLSNDRHRSADLVVPVFAVRRAGQVA